MLPSMQANIDQLKKKGYQPIIQTTMPDVATLQDLRKKLTIDANFIPEDFDIRELVTNLRLTAQSQAPEKAVDIVIKNLDDMISALEKLKGCIETKKVIPQQYKTNQDSVTKAMGKLSQRLFVRDGKFYVVSYKDLIQESKDEITPIPASNYQGTFAVMAGYHPDGTLALEHRINWNPQMQGHPALVDYNFKAVVSAGEEFICGGEHKLSGNKTGNCNEQVTSLELSIDEERALLNISLHGLAREFYQVKLITDTTNIDEEDYRKARDAAGVDNSTPILKSPMSKTQASGTRTPSPLGAFSFTNTLSAGGVDSLTPNSETQTLAISTNLEGLSIVVSTPTPSDSITIITASITEEDREKSNSELNTSSMKR